MNTLLIYCLLWFSFELLIMWLILRKRNNDQLKAAIKYPGTLHPSMRNKLPWWWYVQLFISLIMFMVFIIHYFVTD